MGLARVLEVARALATDPRLLLLDEPSSGLNDEETSRLADLLRTLNEKADLSMLVVEHDMGFVLGLSEEVYVLDFGKMIAHGTPLRIRKDPVVQAAYLGQDAPQGAPS
jgi:branched-chain amino acid transport system ATP-binding protein